MSFKEIELKNEEERNEIKKFVSEINEDDECDNVFNYIAEGKIIPRTAISESIILIGKLNLWKLGLDEFDCVIKITFKSKKNQ
jgi:hypothetical protein